MFSGWLRSSGDRALESMQPSDFSPHFDDSNIAHVLDSLGKRLWPESGPNEKADINRVLDWESLRKDVYSRAYRRLGFEGKQAILVELVRLSKAADGREITCTNLPSLFGHFATTRETTIDNHEERAKLIECDGTAVGYLDAIHAIVHEVKDYRDFAKLEEEVRAVWVKEEKGICPFWGLMTDAERHRVLSELDRVVSAIEQFHAELSADHGRELLHTALTDLLNYGLKLRKRPARPQVFDPDYRPRHGVSYYASLAHPLLGQPLSSRKARIYGA